MTSFVHVEQPSQHPGVVRAERAVGSIQQAGRQLTRPRGIAVALLAVGVVALIAAVNHAGDTVSESNLLVGWIALWVVVFAALALIVGPASKGLQQVRGLLGRWTAARRAAQQDEKLWQLALTDARIMADISRAMSSDAAADVKRYN
jgi:hypothetical protein